MSPQALHYYGGAALDGLTMAANRSSFHKCRFLPKVLMDVSSVSPQTELFGVASPLPIYISPAANALVGHPEGEMTLVRGVSTFSRSRKNSIDPHLRQRTQESFKGFRPLRRCLSGT